jgi:hypothetical protein
MRKLNQVQKDMINKRFPWLGHLVIIQVEKLKLEYTLDEAINFAYDIVLDNAE